MKKTSLVSCIFASLLLVGCQVQNSTSSTNGSTEYEVIDSYVSNLISAENKIVTPFNTSMGLRVFSSADNNTIFPIYEKEIQRLHSLFDRYNTYKNSENELMVTLKKVKKEEVDEHGKPLDEEPSLVTYDTFNGASVSTNNIIRIVNSLLEYHAANNI